MTYLEPDLSQLNHSLICAGFRQLVPVSLLSLFLGPPLGWLHHRKDWTR